MLREMAGYMRSELLRLKSDALVVSAGPGGS